MQDNKIEQIKQGLEFSKQMLNSLSISGIENCDKIVAIYHNLEVILNMIKNNEITATKNSKLDE